MLVSVGSRFGKVIDCGSLFSLLSAGVKVTLRFCEKNLEGFSVSRAHQLLFRYLHWTMSEGFVVHEHDDAVHLCAGACDVEQLAVEQPA